MVCRDFILPEVCKPCLFLFLRNLFYLTRKGKQKGKMKAENNKGALKPNSFKAPEVVGVPGFEPGASWTRTKRDTKLRHTPIMKAILL